MSDLVERARRGDGAAFDRLYERHVDRVYGTCLRLTADARRAEELTQDVFVRVWRSIATFRGESRFSTWLYRGRRDELPGEVVRAVDAGLKSLDRAIRRTSEVAGQHPDAPLVRDMLVSRYERKLELLRRTLDLGG